MTEEHSFVSGKYEASFTINTTGSHTLQVTFKKQKYEGSSWVDVNMTSYKKFPLKPLRPGLTEQDQAPMGRVPTDQVPTVPVLARITRRQRQQITHRFCRWAWYLQGLGFFSRDIL